MESFKNFKIVSDSSRGRVLRWHRNFSIAGTVKSFLSVVISGFFITGSLEDLETDFDPLTCCLKDMLFLFGLRPSFSRKICCLDFRKKVTILCKTTTDMLLHPFLASIVRSTYRGALY